MGTIEIFDHVMIGANSMILPNIKIGPNVIVAAGSVVTKDIPEGVVVAGVPAKIIGSFDDFAKKRIFNTEDAPEKEDGIDKIIEYYWRENK